MIFASLGTMDMAFIRMAKAIDEWAATTQEEVIVQTGYTHFNYRHAKAFDFCTKDEMQQYIKSADILILQGGWGAISAAQVIASAMRSLTFFPGLKLVQTMRCCRKPNALRCFLNMDWSQDGGSAAHRPLTASQSLG